jgi:hypothetical protein
LCEDEPAIKALVELAKSGRQVCWSRFVSDLIETKLVTRIWKFIL